MFIGVKGIKLKYTNYKTLCAFVINARLQYLCIMYALHSVCLVFKALTVYVTEGNLEKVFMVLFSPIYPHKKLQDEKFTDGKVPTKSAKFKPLI